MPEKSTRFYTRRQIRCPQLYKKLLTETNYNFQLSDFNPDVIIGTFLKIKLNKKNVENTKIKYCTI